MGGGPTSGSVSEFPAALETPIGGRAPIHMPKLFLMTPSGAARQVELQAGENTLGRGAKNDVVVDSIYASRVHAVIVVEPAFVTLKDLGSQNGTYVNGERIQSQTLVEGDLIRVGNCQMQFMASGQEFSQVEALRLSSVPNWLVDDRDGGEAPTAPDVPQKLRGKP